MTPNLLRQLWSVVEATHAPAILGRDDASLVVWLLEQLEQQRSLEGHETQILSDYIRSRTALIRDLAAQR